MKSVVYGCGNKLKSVLQILDVDFDTIVFSDSDCSKWNKIFIGGKAIVPSTELIGSDYEFCVVGSSVYSNEIINMLHRLGFENNQIIPFEFLNGFGERWKKKETFDRWKGNMEIGEHIEVVVPWLTQNEDSVCVLNLSNHAFNEIKLCAFDLFKKKKEIEVYDALNNSLIGRFSAISPMAFQNDGRTRLLKIVVKNGVTGIPWISVRVKTGRIAERISDSKLSERFLNVYQGLLEFPIYDEDYYALSKLDGQGAILDVGANYGQSMFSFYHLSKCDIISFEVRPDLYELLLVMKDIIDNDDRIEVINAGVSDRCEESSFYVPVDPRFSGSFDKTFISGRKLECEIIEKVMLCKPLDDLVDERKDVFFIKMDVEGLEYEALKGAQRIIKRCHPLILIEQNGQTSKIEDFLKNEYELYYYDVQQDCFFHERKSVLNCWLIPKPEYRNSQISNFMKERIG